MASSWLTFAVRLGLSAAILLPTWFVGYSGASFAWILAISAILSWQWNNAPDPNSLKWQVQRELATNEKALLEQSLANLPSWVKFPDVERANWLNEIIKKMWPFITEYVKEFLYTSMQETIQQSLPSPFTLFNFINVDLGDVPIYVGGIKVYKGQHVERDEVVMDVEFSYCGDSRIKVRVGREGFSTIEAGVKNVRMHGNVRVILRPLVAQPPYVENIFVFFLNSPDIDFEFTDTADLADTPFLRSMIRNLVQSIIKNVIVMPNRLPIQLLTSSSGTEMLAFIPKGVLRVYVISADDLKAADIAILKAKTSDPYVMLTVGAQTMKTKVVKKSLSPRWEEYFEFLVFHPTGQKLELAVFDDDLAGSDDFLGDLRLSVAAIARAGGHGVTGSFNLEHVDTGSIRLTSRWLAFSDDKASVDKNVRNHGWIGEPQSGGDAAAGRSAPSAVADAALSSCVVVVSVDSCRNLPLTRRNRGQDEPSPIVRLSMGNAQQQSTVRENTTKPVFRETFSFLCANPYLQLLEVVVADAASTSSGAAADPANAKSIGRATVSLMAVLDKASESSGKLMVTESYPVKLDDKRLQTVDNHEQRPLVVLNIWIRPLTVFDGDSPLDGEVGDEDDAVDGDTARDSVSAPPIIRKATTGEVQTTGADATLSPDSSGVGTLSSTMSPMPDPVWSLHPQNETASGHVHSDRVSSLPTSSVSSPTLRRGRRWSFRKFIGCAGERGGDDNMQVSSSPEMGSVPSSPHGTIRISMRYDLDKSTLLWHIHDCRGLFVDDGSKPPDTYVKTLLYVMAHRGESPKTTESRPQTAKTSTIDDSVMPMFDERHEFALSPHELRDAHVVARVVVKQSKSFGRSKPIGQVDVAVSTDFGTTLLNGRSRLLTLALVGEESSDDEN